MKIVLRKQEGQLPRKMQRWPVNIEAAKRLADKYDALADEGVVTSVNELKAATGFGGVESCTLCAAVFGPEPDYSRNLCRTCIHADEPWLIKLFPCDMHPTYERLNQIKFTPDDLRARASYLRKLISKYE